MSQATVTIGSLNSQDMISHVKVYMIDILWVLYVAMFRSQYSTEGRTVL